MSRMLGATNSLRGGSQRPWKPTSQALLQYNSDEEDAPSWETQSQPLLPSPSSGERKPYFCRSCKCIESTHNSGNHNEWLHKQASLSDKEILARLKESIQIALPKIQKLTDLQLNSLATKKPKASDFRALPKKNKKFTYEQVLCCPGRTFSALLMHSKETIKRYKLSPQEVWTWTEALTRNLHHSIDEPPARVLQIAEDRQYKQPPAALRSPQSKPRKRGFDWDVEQDTSEQIDSQQSMVNHGIAAVAGSGRQKPNILGVQGNQVQQSIDKDVEYICVPKRFAVKARVQAWKEYAQYHQGRIQPLSSAKERSAPPPDVTIVDSDDEEPAFSDWCRPLDSSLDFSPFSSSPSSSFSSHSSSSSSFTPSLKRKRPEEDLPFSSPSCCPKKRNLRPVPLASPNPPSSPSLRQQQFATAARKAWEEAEPDPRDSFLEKILEGISDVDEEEEEHEPKGVDKMSPEMKKVIERYHKIDQDCQRYLKAKTKVAVELDNMRGEFFLPKKSQKYKDTHSKLMKLEELCAKFSTEMTDIRAKVPAEILFCSATK